jgi:predicted nucleic acid-binding protein
MIVVADTSPINYLVLIDQIDLLGNLYEQVLIPAAVHDELKRDLAPQAVREWIRQPPNWLIIRTVTLASDQSTIELDPGEREAIQLAEEVGAEQIVIDDLKGRQEASRRGLHVIGTLGVLREAAHLGFIDIHLVIQHLQTTTFQISPDIIANLLREF